MSVVLTSQQELYRLLLEELKLNQEVDPHLILLKKVFLEARLGRKERDGAPVVVDARGQVLWIPGIARSDLAQCSGSTRELNIGVTNAHID